MKRNIAEHAVQLQSTSTTRGERSSFFSLARKVRVPLQALAEASAAALHEHVLHLDRLHASYGCSSHWRQHRQRMRGICRCGSTIVRVRAHSIVMNPIVCLSVWVVSARLRCCRRRQALRLMRGWVGSRHRGMTSSPMHASSQVATCMGCARW